MNKKNLYRLISLLLIFFFYSCSDKDKELFNPNLDGEFNFSLTKKEYTVYDLVKKESQIKVDSSSTLFLLKFETDEIRKDTTIENFIADVFLDMKADTTFIALTPDTLTIESIVGRDSVEIEEAEIASGTIEYDVMNYTNNNLFFKLYFIGFTKFSGGKLDTLNITFVAPPSFGVPFKKTIPLDGYNYKLPPNQPFQSFIKGFWLKGQISFAGQNIGDSIHIFTKVSNISFNRIKGRVKPIPLGGKRDQTFVNSFSKNIEDFIKGVTFDSMDVIIKARSSIQGLDLKLNRFTVSGTFKDGKPDISLLFKDKYGNWSDHFDTLIQALKVTTITFDQSNTNINTFLNSVPDSIKISSNLTINPLYRYGEVKSSDSIQLSFIAEAWSKWSIVDATFHDSTEIEIGANDRKKFERAKEGNLFIDITTTIPIQAELIAYVTDSNKVPILVNGKRLYLTKNSANDSVVTINPAFTNSGGYVIAPGQTNLIKSLTQEEISALKNAYYITHRYTLNTPNSQMVYLSANNDIKISIRGNLKLNLISDDLK